MLKSGRRLAHYAKKLRDKLAGHLAEGQMRIQRGGEAERPPADLADVAAMLHDQWILIQLKNEAEREARDIVAALERIQDRTYGNCIECNEPIPDKRLEAIPETPLCISCQMKEEASHNGRGAGHKGGGTIRPSHAIMHGS